MSATHTITTAIVYPNARIHVGWAWECLGADWLVRALRCKGEKTFFSTGMDEHSLNVQRAAESKGLEPKAYCDQMAQDIERVLKQMGLSYDRFIRTSDDDHVRVVQALVQRAFDKGDIYPARYEGHYCESCEAYYTDKDLTDGKCPTHQTPTRWLQEENFFFRLSKYEGALLSLLKENPEFLVPENRRNEVLRFVETGLKDFSISRSTFTWGIPLPFDSKHVVYVWFDALINYLTAAGYEFKLKALSSGVESVESRQFDERWAGALHIIGKDISRFHAVYWPAMLMALDLPLPQKVFVHGFIQIKGEKMSKSAGNIVTPDEVMAVTGPDPFRYYLLAENLFSGDGNFQWKSCIEKSNADLGNDFGNCVNRSLSMARKYFPEEVFEARSGDSSDLSTPLSQPIRKQFEEIFSELDGAIQELDPARYIQALRARSRALNLFIDQTKPWVMAKSLSTDVAVRDSLRDVMGTLLEGIRWLATLWMPVLPFGMPEVFRQLGMVAPPEQGAWKTLVWRSQAISPQEPKPVYPRLEIPGTEPKV